MSRISIAALSPSLILVCFTSCMTTPLPDFVPLPENEPLRIFWPTPNHHLFTEPDRFFARTEANPDYGRPGWTRDCGKRLHYGCDVAPIDKNPTGQETTVEFTDCATGTDYESRQPTYVPHDPVFAVAEGVVDEAVTAEHTSSFGIHAVIRHVWPQTGTPFYTLYGHLASLEVAAGDRVTAGQQIGIMGQTSKSTDARKWMAIAPHLHLEIWNADKKPYDPERFLRQYLPSGS